MQRLDLLILASVTSVGCGGPSRPASPTPAASAPAVAAGRFHDYPVGIGACRFISVGEASEVVGAQLQYYAPDEHGFSCGLLPAIGPGPEQPIVEGRNDEPRPNVWVTFVGWEPAWTTPPAGVGEQSLWEDGAYSRLIVKQHGQVARIDVNLEDRRDDADRHAMIEAIGRKVVARLAAAEDPTY